jgi:hypothetical protein
MSIAERLFQRLRPITERRPPDFVIGGFEAPYMLRWWMIPRNKWFNIYLHHFLRSDDDRAPHDHPWINVSFLLSGSYTEHTIAAGGVKHARVFSAGALRFRRAKTAHRVELTHGDCWTLFVTGPVIRQWGFHCRLGWVPWPQFVDGRDKGKIGAGCGEYE